MKPLEGLIVADFSRVLAGPLATATLADLGATVVKVERPGLGDDTRQWGPPWTAEGSAYFECANRSKRSIELDFNDAADRELARTLALRADILVENFLDGTLARRGLGYDELSASNPGLIYCSITGFGSREGAHMSGYDFLVQAVGGLMSITGEPGGEPMKVGVALVDVLTSKDAVIGILAALEARAQTGLGQRVEVNLLSTLLAALGNQAAAYLATGISPTRLGNRHPSVAPYGTFRCKDGHVAICCGNDGQFLRLAVTLGRPELAEDERFATNALRVTNGDALLEVLEACLAEGDAETWVGRLTDSGVPAGRIGDIGSAIALAESLGLEPLVPVGDGRLAQVRSPITFSVTPVNHYLAPPRLGEHNSELRDWLLEVAPTSPHDSMAGRPTRG